MYSIGDDNELDRLSREASGKYDSPGTPNWESLSAELDKVLPVGEEKKRRIVFFWWLLPVLLIGGGVTYWLMPKDKDASTIKTVDQKPATLTGDKKQDAASVTSNTATTPSNTSTNVQKENTATISAPSASSNDKQETVAKKADKIIIAKENSLSGENSFISNGKRKGNANSQADRSKINNEIAKADQPVTDKPAALTMTPAADKEPAKETAKKDIVDQPAQAKTETPKENKIESAPVQEIIPTATAAEEKKPQENKSFAKRGKGWSYGLLAGVDKSTVKFKYQYDAGVNIGAMIGYHFNDKLSIHTGLIYTQKNYKMAGEDFTAPKGTWISYYKLENVEGYCRMWEVPLLARFTISESAKRSFFLSTGLSSYFMTKENYDFSYYTAGQLTVRNNTYDSKDTHIMSIAHFSAGFENRVGKSWSLLVEPYAKIPLGGVGLGNIQLSSFGLNFSVQHRQPSKK